MNTPDPLPALLSPKRNSSGWFTAAALGVIAACLVTLTYFRWREEMARQTYRDWIKATRTADPNMQEREDWEPTWESYGLTDPLTDRRRR